MHEKNRSPVAKAFAEKILGTTRCYILPFLHEQSDEVSSVVHQAEP